MCRIEERIYIKADGSRQKFEDVTQCSKAPSRQRLCSNVTRKITEYYPKNPLSRDDSASPASLNPPTPTGSGTYMVQERRPSTARRPSTRDTHQTRLPSYAGMSSQHSTSPGISTTPTSSILVIREGEDYFCDEDVQLPYRLIRNLGHGHSANVEMVEDINTGSVFARKVFAICGSRTERKHIFNNEIKIIRRLAPHHHIIRVFATYVAKREVGLILHPVADSGDLGNFLQDLKEANAAHSVHQERTKILETSFGCLASGLAFMHHHRIRHKDIKPQNILVHKGSMIYTDFGHSLDHNVIGRSTTTGTPQAFTRKYCAPEVSDYGPRNSKSDIFSLACVFLEILFVLYDGLIPPYPGISYHEYLENSQLRMALPIVGSIGMITLDMLHHRPEDRSSAEDITSKLKEDEADRFCAQCKAVMLLEDEEMPDAPDPYVSFIIPPPKSLPNVQRAPQPILLQRDNRNSTDISMLTEPSPFRSPVDLFYNNPPWNPGSVRDFRRRNIGRFTCKHCNEIFQIRSDHRKHMLKHNRPWKCDIPNCKRNDAGFTTIYDLEWHKKYVHGIEATENSYWCASLGCRVTTRFWPSLDSYKQHIGRMHPHEDEEELIRSSVRRPPEMPTVETTDGNLAAIDVEWELV